MISLKGKLEIHDFYKVVLEQESISLDSHVLQVVEDSFEFLKNFSENKIIYGVNTGFGPMAQYKIEDAQRIQLQYNLIRSHASGTGQPIPPKYVKASMLARLNTLSLGNSGVHSSVIKLMTTLINKDITPLIFEHGGVGASGDLVHFHFHGTKRVTLFAPNQAKYLYKVPFTVHNLETIDMDNPDFEKYPALRQATGLEATMKHGDALYMPSGYWHYITYLDGGFSITLRAFPRRFKKLAKLLSNLIFMRNFENGMRYAFGQKWTDFKETQVLKKLNRRYYNSQANV